MVHTQRLRDARARMSALGIDALFVGASADLRYLIGYDAPPLERLTLLVLPAVGDAALVVPQLEVPRAEASGADAHVAVRSWSEADDPFDHVVEVAGAADVSPDADLAVQDHLWATFLLDLQSRFPGAAWRTATEVTSHLRMRKTPDELARLRAAGAAIDGVHAEVPGLLRPGRTEAEVGRDIEQLILREHQSVAFVIVASGPNGASPHHETGERTLAVGDPVVVDIGGVRDGYYSDCTRTYSVGAAPSEFRDLYTVLQAAQAAGVAAARTGTSAQDVDAACREPITAAGYGELFVHRTGHGIGIEVHEPPYLVAGNDLALDDGMTFSVEPGIYVPGRFGARIEDIVAATATGGDRLNTGPRDLVEVDV